MFRGVKLCHVSWGEVMFRGVKLVMFRGVKLTKPKFCQEEEMYES